MFGAPPFERVANAGIGRGVGKFGQIRERHANGAAIERVFRLDAEHAVRIVEAKRAVTRKHRAQSLEEIGPASLLRGPAHFRQGRGARQCHPIDPPFGLHVLRP